MEDCQEVPHISVIIFIFSCERLTRWRYCLSLTKLCSSFVTKWSIDGFFTTSFNCYTKYSDLIISGGQILDLSTLVTRNELQLMKLRFFEIQIDTLVLPTFTPNGINLTNAAL